MVAERYCLPFRQAQGPELVEGLPRPVMPPPAMERLTPAEQGVLAYLCAGYSNKEIAALLGKAEPTVKHPPSRGFGAAGQVSACLRKFGLSSRMRLMAALR